MRKEGRRGKEGNGREMSQKKRGETRHSRTFCSVLEVFTRQPVSSPSEAHTPSPRPSAQAVTSSQPHLTMLCHLKPVCHHARRADQVLLAADFKRCWSPILLFLEKIHTYIHIYI